MHLRFVTARSGPTTRRYAQLVQSYRRADGMPAQRVVASLGQLSDQEAGNLRLALEASRQGKALVLPAQTPWQPRVLANLAYLDVAVALELWRHWKLSELLQRLIPEQAAKVPASELICMLTLQRCVAPASKLEANRWFPRTALPELMDIEPSYVNNSRIHRVLDQLDPIECALQEALPHRYIQQQGAFSAMLIDMSDTYFEGRGCDLAERGRTKEGLSNRFKIGILLLCNERGYPLRWKVVHGRTQDGHALSEVVDEANQLAWMQGVPIVFDRAMGAKGAVARLVQSNLWFLTAVRRSEISSYTEDLPTASLAQIGGSDDETEHKRLMACAAERVLAAGMHKVDERLYVLDLGTTSVCIKLSEPTPAPEESILEAQLEGGAVWLHQARRYRRMLEEKTFANQAKLAAHLGVTRARMTQIMSLLRLHEALQHEVLAGRYGHISERALRTIANLKGKPQQKRALDEHAATARPVAQPPPRPPPLRRQRVLDARLRIIAYFNPHMFVDQRTIGESQRREVEEYMADLNRRLRRPNKTRTRESVHAQIRAKLASRALTSVFDIDIQCNQAGIPVEASVRLDEQAWAKRRRYDGFVLLVAHPELPQRAARLVRLYRAKDAVEKDFQTIKSDIELRPIFHYTDPKVRAHVTLCMLALLLERTLEDRLRQAGKPQTAPACFEELAQGHLNLLATNPDLPPTYVLTEPTATQRVLLEHLGLSSLADQEHLTTRLHPRSTS